MAIAPTEVKPLRSTFGEVVSLATEFTATVQEGSYDLQCARVHQNMKQIGGCDEVGSIYSLLAPLVHRLLGNAMELNFIVFVGACNGKNQDS